MLNDLVHHVREDVAKVSEPKAQALFEATAEVLRGLATALTTTKPKLNPCGAEGDQAPRRMGATTVGTKELRSPFRHGKPERRVQ